MSYNKKHISDHVREGLSYLNMFNIPPEEISVERGIADFRNGYPVIIKENNEYFLVQGTEKLNETYLQEMDSFAHGQTALILTNMRIKNITGKEINQNIGRLPLPSLSFSDICDLTQNSDYKKKLVFQSPLWIDHVALELARLSLILPALLILPLSKEIAIQNTLLQIDAEPIRNYRKNAARQIKLISRAPVPLEKSHESEFVVFRGGEGLRDQVAIIIGNPDLSMPVSVRLHSACLTGDLFGSLKCDCGDQLRSTIALMAEQDGGILLYLDQEGRGNGISNKIRAYQLQAHGYNTYDADEVIGFGLDQRHFDFAAEMLRQLGVTKVRLMTNNPLKISALREAGLDIVSDQRITGRITEENKNYLETKRTRAGHLLTPLKNALCPDKGD